MTTPHRSTMGRDIASGYALSAARVIAWVVVSAIVYRRLGEAAFAMLALGRATIGLLAYTSIGLAPAMIRLLAEAQAQVDRPLHESLDAAATRTHHPSINLVFSNGLLLALLVALIGVALSVMYGLNYATVHIVPDDLQTPVVIMVLLLGLGTAFRLTSDVGGAVLQTRGRIALDNHLQAGAELLWMVLSAGLLLLTDWHLAGIGGAFLGSGLVLMGLRMGIAFALAGRPSADDVRLGVIVRLVTFGVMVMLSQTADFLYAPVDYILINRFLDPVQVAHYAPAVQIDGGMLLLVSALAVVLLPKAAMAHASGDHARVRRYYIRGTLASAAVLGVTGLVVWLVSPWIFHLWLGNDMPQTQAILPLVLVHTVVGGSSAVGRSVLIGMGKVVPYTISVIASGLANVVLSAWFIVGLRWGLWGVVIATVIVVVLRAGVWMPWYVLKNLPGAR